MDCEKLILLIEERKPLWNQKEPNYHMRNVQKKLWNEVSVDMNEPVEELKKKWRGLRDTFRKEVQKQMNLKSGSGGDVSPVSKWPFFNQLFFLVDTIKPRKMASSVPPIEEVNEESSTEDYVDIPSTSQQKNLSTPTRHSENVDDGHQEKSVISTPQKLFKSPPKKRKASRNDTHYDEQLLELERRKVNYLENKTKHSEDGDYQFLMSLLPYLHDIPKHRKLSVRTKIMAVVIEEFEDQKRSESSTPECFHSNSASTPHSTPIYYDSDSSHLDHESLPMESTAQLSSNFNV